VFSFRTLFIRAEFDFMHLRSQFVPDRSGSCEFKKQENSKTLVL